MIYHVINGQLSIGSVKIQNLTSASTLFIGDTRTTSLLSIFEGPPEEVIVGVTVGITPGTRRQ